MKVIAAVAVGFPCVAQASIVPFYSQVKKLPKPAECEPGKLCSPSPGIYTGTELLIDINVGGQQQRVQFDTGSSDLALFTKQCGQNCGKHVLQPYDFTRSGSMIQCSDKTECAGYNNSCYNDNLQSLKNGCQFYNTYGDGSGFQAVVFKETFGMWGEQTTTKLSVGAILNQHGGEGQDSFEGVESDGILGTAFMPLSQSDPKAKSNPIVALAKAEGKPGIFSMCFAQGGGGAFGIGEELPYYTGDFVTEPLLLHPKRPDIGKDGYWSVTVKDVKVYGESVGVPSHVYTQEDCLVDSGTTVMGLPEDAFKYIVAAMLKRCRATPLVGLCQDVTGQQISFKQSIFAGNGLKLTSTHIAQYPSIDVVMSNSTVSVPPESYIVCLDDPDEGHVCVAMLQAMPQTILGDGFLGGLMTVYDQDNMNIRFAKAAGCPGPATSAASSGPTVVV